MDSRAALEKLEKAIDELREKNRTTPIIVEGEKDVAALHSLNIDGEILMLHCGKDIAAFCDDVALRHKEVIVLTDWDRKGWSLSHRIEDNLRGRTKCIMDYRIIFAANSMVKDMESLPKFLKNLRKKVKGKIGKKERNNYK